LNSLPPKEYASLPKLDAPAGYICVLRDIDRDVYRIDSTDHPAAYVDRLLADLAITFGIELVSILATDDLNASTSELYNHHGATLGAEWLELDPLQLQELRGWILQSNTYGSCYLTAQSIQAERVSSNQPYMDTHEWEALPRLYKPAGYVYLLQDVEVSGHIKIGFTNHPKRRLSDFGVTLPFETKVVLILESDDAVALERALHQHYAAHRKKGEWFDLSAAEVQEIRNWDTGMSTPSDYATLSASYGRAEFVNQYVPQEESPYSYEEEPSDYYGEELPYLYEDEQQHDTEAEKKKEKWKTGCLYAFLFLFAAGLLGELDLNSPVNSPSSSARQNRPALRVTVSTANRATVSTANRASAATYYVKTSDGFPANVRECPQTKANCAVIGRLLPGDAVRQMERVAGENIGGNENWIKFRHSGKIAYIHSSVLSSSRVSAPTYHVTTKNNASAAVRSCPQRTIDCKVIGGLLPGAAIQPQEAVAGESVNGNVTWFKFRLNGKMAYIHSSLVAARR